MGGLGEGGTPASLAFSSGEEGTLVVRIAGELDLAGTESLEREIGELMQQSAEHVVVDLTQLEFIDSSGVAILLRLANHVGPLDLIGSNRRVQQVVRALGLTDRLRIVPGGKQ